MAVSCVNLHCIIISVDFRNGPEVKCPRGQMDFAEALVNIIDNQSEFNIDIDKICLAGVSGGAWIVCGAVNLLAKQSAIHLKRIRALFIQTGMLSDECGRLSEDHLEPYERDWGQHARVMTSIYKLHATNFA